MTDYLHLLAALAIAHFLCDFPLQGEFLAHTKSPVPTFEEMRDRVFGVGPATFARPWRCSMAAHCAIQAGGVWLVTGSLLIGCAEFLAHWWLDVAKCRGRITFNADQVLHLLCKAAWAAAAVM